MSSVPAVPGRSLRGPLSAKEAEALPDGARVVILWSGGNGPCEYTVRVGPRGHRRLQTDQEKRLGLPGMNYFDTHMGTDLSSKLTRAWEVVAG
jgi:hypothetical protein